MPPKTNKPEVVLLTVERATELLEHNEHNRQISDQHVHRIARQIIDGKWKFNGDTIKIADTGDVLDGQHRLWAIIESKMAVETIVVSGISRDAFATVDTIRRLRSPGDVIVLNDQRRYANAIASALQWMLRWQRDALEDYRAPRNRIENSDVEAAFGGHPGIVRAVERVRSLRQLGNVSLLAFLYYIMSNRNAELAERMIATLEEPAGVGVNDPFFRLRSYFTSDHHRKKDALMTIALTFKAANAAHRDQKIQSLSWRSQGTSPEAFPKLEI